MSIQPVATLPANLAAGNPGVRPETQGAPPGRTATPADAPTATADVKKPPSSADEVDRAVEDIKEFVSVVAQNLQFTVDKETGITVIKVTDASTKEVIRQIPSDEILAIARALDRFRGLLIEQKA